MYEKRLAYLGCLFIMCSFTVSPFSCLVPYILIYHECTDLKLNHIGMQILRKTVICLKKMAHATHPRVSVKT